MLRFTGSLLGVVVLVSCGMSSPQLTEDDREKVFNACMILEGTRPAVSDKSCQCFVDVIDRRAGAETAKRILENIERLSPDPSGRVFGSIGRTHHKNLRDILHEYCQIGGL